MARAATNQQLQKAKKNKSDEFYTQMCDIERELQHYVSHFKDKVIYCNCDDPANSNFVRYFLLNFKKFSLRKLIASCYKEQVYDLFSSSFTEPGYYCEYTCYGDNITTKRENFKGDGDFRSEESIHLLQQSDIVVTNPPFSLLREHVSQIMSFKKQFLIIGTINAITYKEIFNLIQDNKIWLGINLGRGISGFIVPDHYDLYGTEVSVNQDGQHIISTNNCLWLTNLEIPSRHEYITLTKQYKDNENAYPFYDNCEGINIDKTQDIPMDFDGLMGVPITFLHKYNPNQFEIVRFRKGDDGKDLCVNGKCPYFRILIKSKQNQRLQYPL